jgi:hypothetical protein
LQLVEQDFAPVLLLLPGTETQYTNAQMIAHARSVGLRESQINFTFLHIELNQTN